VCQLELYGAEDDPDQPEATDAKDRKAVGREKDPQDG
jgi:hypothetical protein